MDEDENSSLIQGHTASNNTQLDDNNPDLSCQNARKCKVYKRRWYILFVFSLTSIVLNFMWNTWGPIQRPCRVVFGWETWTVLLLSSFGSVGAILGFIPSTWLMDAKGLRTSVFVTSLMLLVGKAIQVIPFSDTTVKTVFIYVGHLVTMLPSFIASGAPPLVSSTWFPPNERTTATAIGTLAGIFGAALAFFIGPSMMPTPFNNSGNSSLNLTTNEIRLIEVRLRDYFYLQTGLAALLFGCIAVYFPSRPPLPPSIAALTKEVTEIGYVEGFKLLIRNQSYWLLVFVLAASFGIYFGWASVLDLAVQPFNISEKTSGWLGTGSSLAGIISGIIIARSADVVKRWTKEILLGLFIGTVVSQLIFAMTCLRILPFSKGLLFASIICGGLFFNGTIPLVFELIMECVFPVGEGTSVGIGLVVANSVLFMFDAAFMFPRSNVQWMNWVSVGGIAFCIPLLLVYKSQYRRLDLDKRDLLK